MKHAGKKRRRARGGNRLQTKMIFVIVGIIFCAVAYGGHKTKIKKQEYAATEAELDLQIAEAEAEKKALDDQEEYMQTDAYKEQVAREQFGMVKKGEYILKEKEGDTGD